MVENGLMCSYHDSNGFQVASVSKNLACEQIVVCLTPLTTWEKTTRTTKIFKMLPINAFPYQLNICQTSCRRAEMPMKL